MKIFFVQFFCVFLPPLLNKSASVRSLPFLSFIEPIFAWNVPMVSLIFWERSLVFSILLFSSICLHWLPRKTFFISSCYSLELCIQMLISFLFSFAFGFSLDPNTKIWPVLLWRYCWGKASVQFSHSVVSDSLLLHELQHAKPSCPSPTPGVHSNSCPLSWWCHPAILNSVVPFSSCPQSLSASGSFPMSQLFSWSGQCIGVSASASVLPMNTQDLSPLGWTDWISLQSKGLSRVFSNTTVQKHHFFSAQLSLQSNSYIHTSPLEKP